MANTPIRNIRVPDWIWDPAKRRSQRVGIPIAKIVRAALRAWGRSE